MYVGSCKSGRQACSRCVGINEDQATDGHADASCNSTCIDLTRFGCTATVLTCSKKHCKHFNRGKGTCPFNEKCFYLHAYPDGRVASPRPVRRRQHPEHHRRRPDVPVYHSDVADDDDDDDDDDVVIMDNVSLYDIIELLNERVTLLADRLEHSLAPLLHRHTTLSSSDDDE